MQGMRPHPSREFGSIRCEKIWLDFGKIEANLGKIRANLKEIRASVKLT